MQLHSLSSPRSRACCLVRRYALCQHFIHNFERFRCPHDPHYHVDSPPPVSTRISVKCQGSSLRLTTLWYSRRASGSRGVLRNKSIRIPLASTVVLYTSTAIYMSALVWNHASVTRILSQATDGLFSETYNGVESLAALEATVLKQSWMATVALGINVSIHSQIQCTSCGDECHLRRSCLAMPSSGGAHVSFGDTRLSTALEQSSSL